MLGNSVYKIRGDSKRYFKNIKPKPHSNKATKPKMISLHKVVFCLSCHHVKATMRSLADL